MTDLTESLATLQTRVIDASEGHAEGAERAEDATLRRVFQELHALHKTHGAALSAALAARGVEPDDDGSYLKYVHKAVLAVRSAFGALDEGALPSVRDGEERILELYDETAAATGSDVTLRETLAGQRRELAEAIDRIRALERAAA